MMPFPTSSGDLATALALLTVGMHSVIAARARPVAPPRHE
jgi:hypothetical protein